MKMTFKKTKTENKKQKDLNEDKIKQYRREMKRLALLISELQDENRLLDEEDEDEGDENRVLARNDDSALRFDR